MHPAEIALRRAAKHGGFPAKAVAILDCWNPAQRKQFRAAYAAEDWRTLLLLRPSIIDMPPHMQSKVWVHLLDATTT